MLKKIISAILCLLLFACSQESEEVNSSPSQFSLEDISFAGTVAKIRWSKAQDADQDEVFYNVYLNSELIKGPVSQNEITTTLEYNRDYEGLIIATDRNGGTTELKFNFKGPASKIILVSDFQSGQVVAIDLDTRSRIWTAPNQDGVHSVNNDLVYSGVLNLTAHHLFTGEKVWEKQPVNRSYDIGYRHLMADDQNLYSITSDMTMVAIDLERQEKQWEISLFDSNYRYAMDEAYLYIPKRNNHELIAVNKYSGEIKWEFGVDNPVSSLAPFIEHAPLVHGGNLYFQDNNGRFYSVNKLSGAKNYSLDLGKYSKTAPVWANGNVIFTARDEIFSVKATTGTINWRYYFGDVSQSSPFKEDGKIFVGAGNHLFCFDALTGALRWKSSVGATVVSSPIVYDGKVYVSSHSARLHCLNAENGNMEWEVGNVTFSVSSPTLIIGNSEKIIHPSDYGLHYN